MSDLQQTSPNHKSGWVSPRYNCSCNVHIDEQQALENRCVALRSELPEVEHYRILRTQILQRTPQDQGSTIMITSPRAGDGKTLTAINLALSFAREYAKTALLVDCDLRKQQIQQCLGIRSGKGLVDYLLDDCPVSEMIIWPGIEKVTLISGGRTIGESTELLGSPRMQQLVAEMKGRYPDRYVFFDVPAVLDGADALAFAPFVDYILLAVRAGVTAREDIQRAASLLPQEKLLGVVLNGEQKGR